MEAVVGCMIVKGILVQTVLGAPMERLALVKPQIGFTILNNVRKAMWIHNTKQCEESNANEDLIVLDDESAAEKWLTNKKLVEGSVKAICKHCRTSLVAGNRKGTSHLKYHLKACSVLCSSKRKRTSGTPKADIPKFEQKQSREDFSRMIVCHNYPFNMAKHYYTRLFITLLQPFFKLSHRTSVTADCHKLYEFEKE